MGGMETTRGGWWHGDQQVGPSEGCAEGTATNNHTAAPLLWGQCKSLLSQQGAASDEDRHFNNPAYSVILSIF